MDESRANRMRDTDILTGNPMHGTGALALNVVAGADGNGEPLFVINLCAAMTPIDLDGLGLAGLDQYKLYQVSRMEDGRRRYRLRLGFFTTEAHAEDVLSSVRARYATAFASCLCEEDLKHATGYLKCSVQDLQRTGRYAVQKLRGDSGATTSIRALDTAALVKLQAAEARAVTPVAVAPVVNVPVAKAPVVKATISPIKASVYPHLSREQIVEVSWQPEPRALHKAPAKPQIAAQPIAARPLQAAAANSTPRPTNAAPAPKVDAPKRESLMQRAHAMAPVDSADRAKALPKHAQSMDIDMVTTGQFKLPASPPPRVTLQASTPPLQTPTAPIQKSNQAFHVGAGVQIPDTWLTLESAQPAAATQAKPPVKQVSPIGSTAPMGAARVDATTTTDLLRARELAKQSTQWRQDHGEIPSLDTTQTIRTLTKNELDDAHCPKWFTVQLAISDHPANLDTMPRLDIFEAYSLYSVAVMEGSGIRHALRLGFFREEVSAHAVMGYLKTFFGEPLIVRIPDAEHDRFVDAPKISALVKPAAIPAASVITLEQKAMPHADTVPTVNSAVERTSSMVKQPPRGIATQVAKPMARSAAPATKRAAHIAQPTAAKKPAMHAAKLTGRPAQKDLLDEARLLGLSDTAIIRVQKNPSLLSRLVGKLGK